MKTSNEPVAAEHTQSHRLVFLKPSLFFTAPLVPALSLLWLCVWKCVHCLNKSKSCQRAALFCCFRDQAETVWLVECLSSEVEELITVCILQLEIWAAKGLRRDLLSLTFQSKIVFSWVLGCSGEILAMWTRKSLCFPCGSCRVFCCDLWFGVAFYFFQPHFPFINSTKDVLFHFIH